LNATRNITVCMFLKKRDEKNTISATLLLVLVGLRQNQSGYSR
jgi:hypothetical protein